jgi:hypothetical protein
MCAAGMPRTGMSRCLAKELDSMLAKCLGRETGDVGKTRCSVDLDSILSKCLGRDCVGTCLKYSPVPEDRERMVSHTNGDMLRVTRCRMVRKSADQVERKKTPVKRVHNTGKTTVGKRTNPVLSDGHPQDVAHPATAEEAESDPHFSAVRAFVCHFPLFFWGLSHRLGSLSP